jgi:hypothetical protein
MVAHWVSHQLVDTTPCHLTGAPMKRSEAYRDGYRGFGDGEAQQETPMPNNPVVVRLGQRLA